MQHVRQVMALQLFRGLEECCIRAIQCIDRLCSPLKARLFQDAHVAYLKHEVAFASGCSFQNQEPKLLHAT